MRSTSIVIALSLATALAAAGCKKAEQKAADPAPKDLAKVPEVAKPPAPAGSVKAPEAAAPSATTLKFDEAPAKVGDKRTKTDDSEVLFQVDAKGKKVDVKVVKHKEEQVEILAVDGAIPMKIKIAYPTISSSQTISGAVKTKPEVLDGKTYVVWSEGGAIKATTADGAAVSAEELAELADENDELGKPDTMEQILEGRTWTIGETYDFTADDLAKLKARSTASGKPVATAMSLTLQSFDATQAIFALTMAMTQTKDPDTLTFAMKGTAHVALPSAHATALAMDGAITGTANGMPTAGTMTAKTIYTY